MSSALKTIEAVAQAVGLIAPAVPAFVAAVEVIARLFQRPPKREDGTTWTPEQILARIESEALRLVDEAGAERSEWEDWMARRR